jgi:hypothetical protein
MRRSSMPSKLDLVLIAASVAAVVGFIERAHSVVIDPPDAVELAALPAPTCSDDERYGSSRLVFLEEGFLSGVRPSSACERN